MASSTSKKWQKLFNSASTGEEELVNNIDEGDDEEEEVTMDRVDKEDNHKEEEEEEDADTEEQGGKIDRTDFEDLKTFKDIRNFANFPNWLQSMIKEFMSVFTNQISEQSVMNVEPVKFSLRKNVKIPNNNLTAHLPPANLRESADRLLNKLERGGLIKKAPRVCKYKSKAFFKPKRNNEARLLIDYKASQVNNLIERPTHPQFGVERLVQQVKPGMNYFLSADLTGAYFCHPLQEGPNGGDLTCFLTHKGKYIFKVLPQGCAASQDYLGGTLCEMLDHEALKDGDEKGFIRIIDDIAGDAKNLPAIKKMARTLFSRCKDFNVKLQPSKFQFSTEKINFAGVFISKEGVQPDP